MAAMHAKLQSMVEPGKYDLVLRVDHCLDVFDEAKGWKMAVGAQSDERLESCTSVRIAPIGRRKVGKTWLISKLCEESLSVAAGQGLELACGDAVDTIGLNVKLCRIGTQMCVFLDTVGLDSPVTSAAYLSNMGRAAKELTQELMRHENLVKRVAFDFAQVYLVVLGYVSVEDQLEIVQLVEQARRKPGTLVNVIVVHNLKDMTYKQFMEEKDALTGLTYLEAMERAFMLRRKEVTMTDDESIVELNGSFDDDQTQVLGRFVSIRHVFLTYDGPTAEGAGLQRPADPNCRNKHVFEFLRRELGFVPPKTSHIPAELSACVSRFVLSMVHLPPKTHNAEVRYDKANRRMIARVVSAETRKKEREEMQVPLVTGTSALPKYHGVTTRSVVVAATSKRTSGDVIQHNASRVRAYYADVPLWLCKVTIVAPALGKGEVQRLRETVQWTNGNVGAEGAWMEERMPWQEPSLKLCFTVTMRNMPEAQPALLARAGSCITFPAPMVVYDKGTRPFSNDDESIEQVVVPVEIHTNFTLCIEELAPVIHYGRGLLTVAVLCDLAETDRRDAANREWVNNADPTAIDVFSWEPGANGSDEDLDE